VVLTDEDLKSLPEERSHEIEVVEFVPSEQVDPIMFDRSYFLEPDKGAAKPYALLPPSSGGHRSDSDRTVLAAPEDPTRRIAVPREGLDAAIAALGRRSPRGRFFQPEGRRARLPAGAEDGNVAGRQHVHRFQPRQIRRRISRSIAAADRRQTREGRRVGHCRHVR
jgi:hypothetical protein